MKDHLGQSQNHGERANPKGAPLQHHRSADRNPGADQEAWLLPEAFSEFQGTAASQGEGWRRPEIPLNRNRTHRQAHTQEPMGEPIRRSCLSENGDGNPQDQGLVDEKRGEHVSLFQDRLGWPKLAGRQPECPDVPAQ